MTNPTAPGPINALAYADSKGKLNLFEASLFHGTYNTDPRNLGLDNYRGGTMDRTEDQRLIDSAREYGMEFPSVPCGECGEPTYFLPGEPGSQESGHYLYHDHATTHYHAGWNMVGYLPEMDSSYPFESFADAKQSLIDDMERECDSLDMADEHDLANELSGVEQDLNLASGPGWGAIVGNISYWINECADDACGEDDDNGY